MQEHIGEEEESSQASRGPAIDTLARARVFVAVVIVVGCFAAWSMTDHGVFNEVEATACNRPVVRGNRASTESCPSMLSEAPDPNTRRALVMTQKEVTGRCAQAWSWTSQSTIASDANERPIAASPTNRSRRSGAIYSGTIVRTLAVIVRS